MSSATPNPVVISYYSDLLCVWAYVSQIRIDELRHQFHEQVHIQARLCSVFADVGTKLAQGWKDRGGVAGYRAHVEQTIARFPHVALHAATWTRTVPTTSATGHACIKAAALVDADAAERLAWALRLAFFRDGRDVSRLDVQLAVVEELGLKPDAVRARLEDGSAWAAVLSDYDEATTEHVRGSPTFVLNERRQILYGNVGYKIIEANVLELLHHPEGQASWC